MATPDIKIACFGEVLWDIFPGGDRRAGGAPFNVAYHLSKMGVEVNMISSVGNDELGRELLQKYRIGKSRQQEYRSTIPIQQAPLSLRSMNIMMHTMILLAT